LGTVVVVAGEPANREEIGRSLATIGCAQAIATIESALRVVGERRPDVVIVAAAGADPSPEIECLQRLHRAYCSARYVLLTAVSSEDIAIRALHSGGVRGGTRREGGLGAGLPALVLAGKIHGLGAA
jgi:DNA-binding NarL/FixJ family response regulator